MVYTLMVDGDFAIVEEDIRDFKDAFLNSNKSLGELLYENDPKKLSAINSYENKRKTLVFKR